MYKTALFTAEHKKRTFDTNCCQFLVEKSNDLLPNDFYYVNATLCCQRNDNGEYEYFVLYEGGAGTTWGKRTEGDNRCSGKWIVPVTKKSMIYKYEIADKEDAPQIIKIACDKSDNYWLLDDDWENDLIKCAYEEYIDLFEAQK